MPTFANKFKGEVSRLAKKEVKAETQALKKTLAANRGEIASLKRRLADLESLVKKISKESSRSKSVQVTEDVSGASLRFRAKGFTALRKKLGPRWPGKFLHLWPGQIPPPDRGVILGKST